MLFYPKITCIFIIYVYLSWNLLSPFTHFFRQSFWPEKQTPPICSLLECMVMHWISYKLYNMVTCVQAMKLIYSTFVFSKPIWYGHLDNWARFARLWSSLKSRIGAQERRLTCKKLNYAKTNNHVYLLMHSIFNIQWPFSTNICCLQMLNFGFSTL